MTNTRDNGLVRFRFYRPDVNSVAVAGDFNDWRESSGTLSMQPDVEEGWWVAEAQFEPGEYRFRYLADGRWFTDFASHGVELTKRGWDSVLVVHEIEQAKHQPASMAA